MTEYEGTSTVLPYEDSEEKKFDEESPCHENEAEYYYLYKYLYL